MSQVRIHPKGNFKGGSYKSVEENVAGSADRAEPGRRAVLGEGSGGARGCGRPSWWPGGPRRGARVRARLHGGPGPVTAATSVLNPLSCIQQSVQLTFQEDMEIWKF